MRNRILAGLGAATLAVVALDLKVKLARSKLMLDVPLFPLPARVPLVAIIGDSVNVLDAALR